MFSIDLYIEKFRMKINVKELWEYYENIYLVL